jgi:hypothetical protein
MKVRGKLCPPPIKNWYFERSAVPSLSPAICLVNPSFFIKHMIGVSLAGPISSLPLPTPFSFIFIFSDTELCGQVPVRALGPVPGSHQEAGLEEAHTHTVSGRFMGSPPALFQSCTTAHARPMGCRVLLRWWCSPSCAPCQHCAWPMVTLASKTARSEAGTRAGWTAGEACPG